MAKHLPVFFLSHSILLYIQRPLWKRGFRWLAAPALLVAALEATSDLSDTLLVTILRSPAAPSQIAMQTFAACSLVAVEILVWLVDFLTKNNSLN